MFIEVTLCLLATLIALIYYRETNSFNYWRQQGVKYLKPLPLVGSVGSLLLFREHLADFLQRIYNEHKREKFIGYYRMKTPVLLVNDLELIKNILVKDFQHFTDHGLQRTELEDSLSDKNLFMMDGQKWKDMRAKLTPTFTSGRMKAMFPLVLECATRLETYLDTIANSEENIDMKDLLARYTTDVIGSCAFGIQCDSINDPNNEFRAMGRKFFDADLITTVKRGMLLFAPKLVKLLQLEVNVTGSENFFRALTRDVMSMRVKTGEKRKDFIQLLMEIKEKGRLMDDREIEDKNYESEESKSTVTKFTDNDITAQAFVFFIAGFETSSSALTYALFELSRRPDLQRTARRHIEEVLQRHDGQVTYQALQEMTYLDWILQESLRKYPPLAMLPRICTKNYVIPGTDVLIEKGVNVVIPIHAIQNDPDFFEHPQTFKPERHANEQAADQNIFLSFGEGPRQCIGLRFARMQSKLGLLAVLHKFEVQLSTKINYPLTLDPRQFLLISKENIFLKVASAPQQ